MNGKQGTCRTWEKMKRPLQERGSGRARVENGKSVGFQVARSLSSNSGFTTFWLSYFEEIFISILMIICFDDQTKR